MFNSRGLVCVFEAGYQQTREQDAKKVCTAMNAAPDLYAALDKAESELERMESITGQHCDELVVMQARAALSRARGE